MAYKDFEDLPRRTASDKVLRDIAFNIAKNPKYNRCEHGLASMVCKFFDEKFSDGAFKSEITLSQELAEKLRKTKSIPNFKGNGWGVDLADMQLISKFDKGFRFLLYVIDVYSKYTWVVPLKDKKSITIINAFQKNLVVSGHNPSKT